MQSLQEAQLTDHIWQLGEAVGLQPEGPEVVEQAQLPGEVGESVVSQVEGAELLQGAHHLGQNLEVVEIQGQNLQVLQLLQLRRQVVEVVVAQVELDQLMEGAHKHREPAQLAPAQVHHLVHWHLPELFDHVVLAAVGRDEGREGPDGVPHVDQRPVGLLLTAVGPVLSSRYSWGMQGQKPVTSTERSAHKSNLSVW